MFCRFFFDEHEVIARREKRLARYAAHVEASPAQFLVFFDKSSLQSELTRTDRGNVAAGAGANDKDVKFFHN